MLLKDVVFVLSYLLPTSNIITTLYKIMAKHFQHFKTKKGYFSVWKEVFSYLETERFVPIIGDIKSRKKDWNRLVWLTREFKQFCPLFPDVKRQRRC